MQFLATQFHFENKHIPTTDAQHISHLNNPNLLANFLEERQMGHVQLLDTTTIAVAQSSLPEVIVGHMYACILFAASCR